MIRRFLALALAVTMLAPARDGKPSLKELVLGIPTGSIIEVKLSRKEKPNKIVGRIGETTGEGIQVQVVRNQKVTTMQLAFADVKSLKLVSPAGEGAVKKGTSPVVWVVLGGLAALGIIVVIGLIGLTVND